MLRRIFHCCRRAIFPRLDGRKDVRASSIIIGLVVVLGAVFAMAAVIERALGGN